MNSTLWKFPDRRMLYVALALSAILIATVVVQSATIATLPLGNAMLGFQLAASPMSTLSAALNSPSFAIAFSALTLLAFAALVSAVMTTTASGGNSWGTLIQFRFNRFYSRFLKNAARYFFKRNYALDGALFSSGTLRAKSFLNSVHGITSMMATRYFFKWSHQASQKFARSVRYRYGIHRILATGMLAVLLAVIVFGSFPTLSPAHSIVAILPTVFATPTLTPGAACSLTGPPYVLAASSNQPIPEFSAVAVVAFSALAASLYLLKRRRK